MQRPNRLRVITLGDGPASEFYYDGKTITAFAPAENLVAVAPAPPTSTRCSSRHSTTPRSTFRSPTSSAPTRTRTSPTALNMAFYIGQSKVVGGIATDMVAVASDTLFMQIWIGADDKLPRMMRAVFRGDPLRFATSSSCRTGSSIR